MKRMQKTIFPFFLAVMLCLCAAMPNALAFSFSSSDSPKETEPPMAQTQEVQPEATVESPYRYGKTNIKGVNIRSKASADGEKNAGLPNSGTIVLILDQEDNDKGETWYAVLHGNIDGYIRSDLLDLVQEQDYITATGKTAEQAIADAAENKNSGSSSKSSSGSSSSKSSRTVYVTSGGKSYHSSSSCSNMSSPRAVTQDEAMSSGRSKCTKCW